MRIAILWRIMLMSVFHLAVQSIHLTARSLMCITLQLKRGMSNAILFSKHRLDVLHHGSALCQGHIGGLDVSREGVHATGNTPDMHVIDALDLFHLLYIGD